MERLPAWTCKAIVYQPFEAVAPGIALAYEQNGIDYYEVDREPNLERELPSDAAIVVFGASAAPFR